MHSLFRRAGQASRRARILPLILATLAVVAQARAADINILTAGTFKPVLLDLATDYAARTGNTFAITNDTTGGVLARVMRGEESDLIILPTAALESLAERGKIVPDSVIKLAKSGIGAVVKGNVPPPDISTVEAFKATMLAVPSFAYIDPASGGTSGVYLGKLFADLGIAPALARKAVLVPGGLVASRVDNGEAVLGLQQISDLRVVRGLTFVGPLPEAIQQYTTYGAGIPTTARRPVAARALLVFLHGETATRVLTERGLELP